MYRKENQDTSRRLHKRFSRRKIRFVTRVFATKITADNFEDETFISNIYTQNV